MNKTNFILVFLLLLIFAGCSTRFETPVTTENHTTIYPPKNSKDVVATIEFGTRLSKKTGDILKPDSVFYIKPDSKLYAVIKLENREYNFNKELQFHIDWLEQDGSLLYRKQVDFGKSDSSNSILSSISISSDKRQVGEYKLKVYLFRELIAEKEFILDTTKREPPVEKIIVKEKPKPVIAHIILCRKINKKTGKLIGEGASFEIKKKNKVLALVKLNNLPAAENKKLKFYIDWIGPNDSSLFRKKIDLIAKDSAAIIESSISVYPDKREPGNYAVRIYLSKNLLVQKKFELVKPEKKQK
jgi:hypothetical protein